MIIGVPKEIKNNENRVSITPAGVFTLCKAGHQVYIETKAGIGSGFSDDEYKNVGAKVCTCDEVFLFNFFHIHYINKLIIIFINSTNLI